MEMSARHLKLELGMRQGRSKIDENEKNQRWASVKTEVDGFRQTQFTII